MNDRHVFIVVMVIYIIAIIYVMMGGSLWVIEAQ